MSSDLATQIPDLKIQIYEILNHIFNGYQMERKNAFGIETSDSLVDGEAFHPIMSNGDRTPNYIREEFRWKNAKWITHKGQKIALAQSRPHGIIKIMNVHAKNRYIRNMFIVKLHDSFPKVKVIYD